MKRQRAKYYKLGKILCRGKNKWKKETESLEINF